MEERILYKTDNHRLMSDLLNDESGVIMRVRLPWGMGVAYAGETAAGFLTISRREERGEITDSEADRVCRLFKESAVDVGRPVLKMKYLIRELVDGKRGRFHVVRYAVYFGVQGSIFDGGEV